MSFALVQYLEFVYDSRKNRYKIFSFPRNCSASVEQRQRAVIGTVLFCLYLSLLSFGFLKKLREQKFSKKSTFLLHLSHPIGKLDWAWIGFRLDLHQATVLDHVNGATCSYRRENNE